MTVPWEVGCRPIHIRTDGRRIRLYEIRQVVGPAGQAAASTDPVVLEDRSALQPPVRPVLGPATRDGPAD